MLASARSTVGARAPRSAWPARLDLLQGATGLLLVLFMGVHAFFVSSILVSKDAMFMVTRAFEGYYLFGRSYPWLVSLAVLGVLTLFVVHAGLAMRKFPASYRQYRTLREHARGLCHLDTTLWIVQVYTGFAMFFLGSAHLLDMLINPEMIGPYASADRAWEGGWLPSLLLLLAVEVHAGVGLYRLAVKWNWFQTPSGDGVSRTVLRRVILTATAGFLLLGLVSLATYVKIGYEHRDRAGERYEPVSEVGDVDRQVVDG
jgi:fumarate reductase subunit C